MSVPPQDVVEVGGRSSEAPQPTNARPAWWVIVLPVAMVTALALVVPGDDDARPGSTTPPSELAPPDLPITATTSTEQVEGGTELSGGFPTRSVLSEGWELVDFDWPGSYAPRVTHGPMAWLAVTTGRQNIAYVSQDGSRWEGHVMPGPTGFGSSLQLAVGEDLMVVAAGEPFSETPTPSWISRDGRDWQLVDFDAGRFALDRLFVADSQAFAIGRVIADRGAASHDGTRPTVFRLNGQVRSGSPAPLETGWSRVTITDESDRGAINAVVASNGDIVAFGEESGAARAWTYHDDGFVPRHVVFMNDVGGEALEAGGIIDVIEASEGRWIAGTRRGIYASSDLVVWTRIRPFGVPAGWRVDSIDGEVVVVSEESSMLFLSGERIPFVVPTVDGYNAVDIASDGGTAVATALVGNGPAMFVRGREAAGVTFASPPADGGRWVELSEAKMSGGFPRRNAGTAQGETFLVIGNRLHRLEEETGRLDLQAAVVGVDQAVAGGELEVVSGSLIYSYQGNGLWTSERLPVDGSVDLVADLPNGRIAYVFEGVSAGLWVESRDGDWTEARAPLGQPLGIVEVPNGVIVTFVVEGGTDIRSLFTSDGVRWDEIDLTVPWQGSGAPFAINDDEVTLIDRWPDRQPLDLPSGSGRPIQVRRVGDSIRVLTDGAVLLQTRRSGPWEILPLDPSHGAIEDDVMLLPGDEIRVAAASQGRVSILRWE